MEERQENVSPEDAALSDGSTSDESDEEREVEGQDTNHDF